MKQSRRFVSNRLEPSFILAIELLMNFSNSDRSDVSDVSWVKKKKKESTRDKSWPKLHTVVTSYRAHVAEHESRMVQKREEDKSIDHRERSKSPPRIPTISLSGHSLPRGPTG